jgi:hypothetical protein
MKPKLKLLTAAIALSCVAPCFADDASSADNTSTSDTPQQTLPWENVMAIYRHDTHNVGGAENLGNGCFYEIFQQDAETNDWYCDFTSNSDIFQYYLYTSADGSTQLGSDGYATNIIYSYNPQYLAVPSTTPPGLTATNSSAYPSTITNCLSLKNAPTSTGALNANNNNICMATKFIRDVKYRATLHVNDAGNNASLSFQRLDWDNYVEGDPTKKIIYFDNSETQWEKVYVYAMAVYNKKYDSTTYAPVTGAYGFAQLYKLGDTDIYYTSLALSSDYPEVTNIIFSSGKDSSTISNFSLSTNSLSYGCFNEALYTRDKICNYGSAYVPKPKVTEQTNNSCTVKSALTGFALYYRKAPKAANNESVRSNQPQRAESTADDSTASNLDGWTSCNGDNITLDFSLLDTNEVYEFKSVSGVNNAADSETLTVEAPNHTVSAITEISADANSSANAADANNGNDANSSAPEYYNLQGIRVSGPIPGQIVIERRGSSLRKILP